jgi:hypothetical protein
MNPDELADRLLEFAARIGKAVDALPGTRLGRHIAAQLIRCGTSPAPNYEEGRAAESRADFVHKLRHSPERVARDSLLAAFDRSGGVALGTKDGEAPGRGNPIMPDPWQVDCNRQADGKTQPCVGGKSIGIVLNGQFAMTNFQ